MIREVGDTCMWRLPRCAAMRNRANPKQKTDKHAKSRAPGRRTRLSRSPTARRAGAGGAVSMSGLAFARSVRASGVLETVRHGAAAFGELGHDLLVQPDVHL